MNGMHITTGKSLTGIDHLRQSIADILTTPIGTRVMRRDYGSLLFELIDQPDNGYTRIRMYAATASALLRWEPRIRISQVSMERTSVAGQVLLQLQGTVLQNGEAAELDLSVNLALKGGQ